MPFLPLKDQLAVLCNGEEIQFLKVYRQRCRGHRNQVWNFTWQHDLNACASSLAADDPDTALGFEAFQLLVNDALGGRGACLADAKGEFLACRLETDDFLSLAFHCRVSQDVEIDCLFIDI